MIIAIVIIFSLILIVLFILTMIDEYLAECFAGVIFIVIIISLIIYSVLFGTKTEYEYLDFDNNRGIAEYCDNSDIRAFSGGKGVLSCNLKDGTVIMVKQYKVKEK